MKVEPSPEALFPQAVKVMGSREYWFANWDGAASVAKSPGGNDAWRVAAETALTWYKTR